MYNYKSPIDLITRDITSEFVKRVDGEIFRAVSQYNINVDKEELLKALAYDRAQFDHGYRAGYNAAKSELVRCEDCKNWIYQYEDVGTCVVDAPDIDGVERLEVDFCSLGERRTDAESN